MLLFVIISENKQDPSLKIAHVNTAVTFASRVLEANPYSGMTHLWRDSFCTRALMMEVSMEYNEDRHKVVSPNYTTTK